MPRYTVPTAAILPILTTWRQQEIGPWRVGEGGRETEGQKEGTREQPRNLGSPEIGRGGVGTGATFAAAVAVPQS